MKPITHKIKSARAMELLGKNWAQVLERGVVIYLIGELGAGKTTFFRGMLRGLGYQSKVKSPTFTLHEMYKIALPNSLLVEIHHFDLYRLNDPEELEYIGIRDYFSGESIGLIEWPEKGAGFLPKADLIINFDFARQGRIVTILSNSEKGDRMIEKMSCLGSNG